MATLKSTTIRINNTNNTTYVMKKYNDNTFKLYTYQKNASTGCYFLVGVQSGIC